MKLIRILKTSLIAALILCGHLVEASPLDFDTLGDDINKKNQTIILVDVLQPLLFGKAGIGVGWRNLKQEYIFYSNYVFSSGALPTTAFKSTKREGGSSSYTRTGFDFGFQLKKRNKLLSKPYKEYIKDFSKHTSFYSGPWFEISHKSGDSEYPSSFTQSYKLWEFKVGGMIGWSFGPPKSVLFFDINLGLGVGGGFGKVFSQYYPPEGEKRNTFLALYKVGIQIGFKL